MSYTKYVMFGNGSFLLISKMTGVEHSVLAGFNQGAHNAVSAGFLYPNNDGTLQSYGQSISTGLKCRDEDGDIITQALKDGKISIVDHFTGHFCLATNDVEGTSLIERSGAEVATFETLVEKRILNG